MKKIGSMSTADLVRNIINSTPDGMLGYAEAANLLAANWERFAEVGLSAKDVERLLTLIRWQKRVAVFTFHFRTVIAI